MIRSPKTGWTLVLAAAAALPTMAIAQNAPAPPPVEDAAPPVAPNAPPPPEAPPPPAPDGVPPVAPEAPPPVAAPEPPAPPPPPPVAAPAPAAQTEWPVCSRTVTDNCVNQADARKAKRKPR